ncbi:MAG: aminoglycoside phosphotransferase family protein [Blastocatellia bacterium]|nr:aminoglycoside phosphotransferase family protein [Blastocatellia bacterium]
MKHLDFDVNYQHPDWRIIAQEMCANSDIAVRDLVRGGGTDHVVFFLNDDLVLKIYRLERNGFERERTALDLFSEIETDVETPQIVFLGELAGLNYIIMTRVAGTELTRTDYLRLPLREQREIAAQLGHVIRQLHRVESGSDTREWRDFVADQASTFLTRQIGQGVSQKVLLQIPECLESNLRFVPSEPTVFLHGDIHFGNLRFEISKGKHNLSGLFDMADSRVAHPEYDLLAIGVLIFQGQRELQREFLLAYGYNASELNEEMRRRLMILTMLYETADLRRYAERLGPHAADLDLYELERAIWAFV